MSQPPPRRSTSPAVWPAIIEWCRTGMYQDIPPGLREDFAREAEGRDALGVRRYGTRLQVSNGRDALRDLLDEALDACAYSRQVAERTGEPEDWSIHRMCIALAARILMRMRA